MRCTLVGVLDRTALGLRAGAERPTNLWNTEVVASIEGDHERESSAVHCCCFLLVGREGKRTSGGLVCRWANCLALTSASQSNGAIGGQAHQTRGHGFLT